MLVIVILNSQECGPQVQAGAQKTGDIYIGGGDIKICVNAQANLWHRLLVDTGVTPP
jgi:hypothetical protein